jgi:hypothetical protein
MNRIQEFSDPEAIFADTRMPFGDHVEEFRARLIRAILGLVGGLLVSFLFGDAIVRFITHPVEVELMEFYNRRVEKIARRLRDGDPSLDALNRFTEVPLQVDLKSLFEIMRQRGFQFPPQAVDLPEQNWVSVPIRIKPLEWQFSGRGLVGRKAVWCLSPTTQVLGHAHGYVPVEKDFRDMELLAERFGVELPPRLRRRPSESRLS